MVKSQIIKSIEICTRRDLQNRNRVRVKYIQAHN